MSTTVRRVTPDEWRRVRAFRLEALHDPAAPVAFLSTFEEESARPDDFWRERVAANAAGNDSAQFVAVTERYEWLGTATGLRRRVGDLDHIERIVASDRIDVVGVYVTPEARGRHVVGLLLAEIASWAASLDATALTLDVHRDNAPARRAYERAGFAPTGVEFTGPIGPELEMSRPIAE